MVKYFHHKNLDHLNGRVKINHLEISNQHMIHHLQYFVRLSITAFLFIIYYLNMKDLQLRSPTIRTPLLKIDNGHLQPKSPPSLTVSPLSLNQSRSFSS
ncbi:hypothetical protein HUG17_2481 [Dermatophagoides farinae]|uniref:Transmembrane protein n=1 Tax=Dermatophagoides farinae TaxID=6954 RepID=A0A9D4NU87_DERFA|nr:hypothetical protein HUG17_2481 [Dermatophagoides farinae]